MFFPERITKIKESDKVLEIGPGALPYLRSNVFLDKEFDNEEAIAQSGHSEPRKLDKPIFYYTGTKFPFKDKEFDYVICSHVIEHVPDNELDDFVLEMKRVGKAGYIEFPNIYYEIINYQDVHLWLMNLRDDEILMLDKKIFKSNYAHRAFREMFYGNDGYMFKAFQRYKDFFFSGFEWEGDIKYKRVKDYDELVDEKDFKSVQNYFKNYRETDERSFLNRLINKVIK